MTNDIYRADQFIHRPSQPFTVMHACGHAEKMELTGSDATLMARLEREADRVCPACAAVERPAPSAELAAALWE